MSHLTASATLLRVTARRRRGPMAAQLLCVCRVPSNSGNRDGRMLFLDPQQRASGESALTGVLNGGLLQLARPSSVRSTEYGTMNWTSVWRSNGRSGVPVIGLLTQTYTPGVPSTVPYVQNGSGSIVQGSGLGVSQGLGLASLLGAVVEVLGVIAVLTAIGALVILVVSNRADPDPSGRRPQSVYFFAVSFVTLMTSVIGSTVVVASAVQLIGRHPSTINNEIARTVVLGGLITVVSLYLLLNHLRRGVALTGPEMEPTTPSMRVGQSYVGVVTFVSVLVLLVVTVLAIYLLFGIAGPGVFGSFGGRAPAVRYFIVSLYLGAAFSVILRTHRDLVAPGLRPFGLFISASAGTRPPPPPDF